LNGKKHDKYLLGLGSYSYDLMKAGEQIFIGRTYNY